MSMRSVSLAIVLGAFLVGAAGCGPEECEQGQAPSEYRALPGFDVIAGGLRVCAGSGPGVDLQRLDDKYLEAFDSTAATLRANGWTESQRAERGETGMWGSFEHPEAGTLTMSAQFNDSPRAAVQGTRITLTRIVH